MQRKRFGVIGVGTWGRMHVHTYRDHPFADVAAVCDRDRERAEQAAARWQVARIYTDPTELIAQTDIDAVSVVTPDFAHTDLVVAALEAGKDVLVEKPLATTLEDVNRIAEVVKRTGRKLMVDFHTRWSPTFTQARDAIAAGEIGKPRHVYYRLSDVMWVPTGMLSWGGKTNVLWFLGSHCVDTMRWMLNDEVARVYAVSRSEVLKSKGVDTLDFVVSTLEFRGGCVAVMENSWILPDGEPFIVDVKCQIVGDAGRILVDGTHHRALEQYSMKGGKYRDVMVNPIVHGRPIGFASESVRYFADCVVGDVAPMVDVHDGVAATKIILGLLESMRQKRPVEL